MPHLAHKDTVHSVKIEFQMNNEYFFSISTFHAVFGTYLY